MAKLRKQRRRKKYGYGVNRKRLRDKLKKTPSIICPQVKGAWIVTDSIKSNLFNMGLAYDPNTISSISSNKLLHNHKNTLNANSKIPEKLLVVKDLEECAHAPRERRFRLPQSQVQWISYLMDKYNDDYEAMERDKKNFYQETWQQIRRKIKLFKGVPEQYNKYLADKEELAKQNSYRDNIA